MKINGINNLNSKVNIKKQEKLNKDLNIFSNPIKYNYNLDSDKASFSEKPMIVNINPILDFQKTQYFPNSSMCIEKIKNLNFICDINKNKFENHNDNIININPNEQNIYIKFNGFVSSSGFNKIEDNLDFIYLENTNKNTSANLILSPNFSDSNMKLEGFMDKLLLNFNSSNNQYNILINEPKNNKVNLTYNNKEIMIDNIKFMTYIYNTKDDIKTLDYYLQNKEIKLSKSIFENYTLDYISDGSYNLLGQDLPFISLKTFSLTPNSKNYSINANDFIININYIPNKADKSIKDFVLHINVIAKPMGELEFRDGNNNFKIKNETNDYNLGILSLTDNNAFISFIKPFCLNVNNQKIENIVQIRSNGYIIFSDGKIVNINNLNEPIYKIDNVEKYENYSFIYKENNKKNLATISINVKDFRKFLGIKNFTEKEYKELSETSKKDNSKIYVNNLKNAVIGNICEFFSSCEKSKNDTKNLDYFNNSDYKIVNLGSYKICENVTLHSPKNKVFIIDQKINENIKINSDDIMVLSIGKLEYEINPETFVYDKTIDYLKFIDDKNEAKTFFVKNFKTEICDISDTINIPENLGFNITKQPIKIIYCGNGFSKVKYQFSNLNPLTLTLGNEAINNITEIIDGDNIIELKLLPTNIDPLFGKLTKFKHLKDKNELIFENVNFNKYQKNNNIYNKITSNLNTNEVYLEPKNNKKYIKQTFNYNNQELISIINNKELDLKNQGIRLTNVYSETIKNDGTTIYTFDMKEPNKSTVKFNIIQNQKNVKKNKSDNNSLIQNVKYLYCDKDNLTIITNKNLYIYNKDQKKLELKHNLNIDTPPIIKTDKRVNIIYIINNNNVNIYNLKTKNKQHSIKMDANSNIDEIQTENNITILKTKSKESKVMFYDLEKDLFLDSCLIEKKPNNFTFIFDNLEINDIESYKFDKNNIILTDKFGNKIEYEFKDNKLFGFNIIKEKDEKIVLKYDSSIKKEGVYYEINNVNKISPKFNLNTNKVEYIIVANNKKYKIDEKNKCFYEITINKNKENLSEEFFDEEIDRNTRSFSEQPFLDDFNENDINIKLYSESPF